MAYDLDQSPPHESLDFDHLNFAQACQLSDTLARALDAVASYSGDVDQVDRVALLLGRAKLQQAAAFKDEERARYAAPQEPSR